MAGFQLDVVVKFELTYIEFVSVVVAPSRGGRGA